VINNAFEQVVHKHTNQVKMLKLVGLTPD